MIFTPFNIEDVLAGIGESVRDAILSVALVLHINLVARCLWPEDPHKEDIVAAVRAVHAEGVLFVECGPVQTGPSAANLGRV